MDTSSLQFVSTFDVFGRSWIFAMVGEESEWTEALTQWLLFAVVMVATFFVTALMLSSARQNAINVSLQEQDIARLKVLVFCLPEVLPLNLPG